MGQHTREASDLVCGQISVVRLNRPGSTGGSVLARETEGHEIAAEVRSGDSVAGRPVLSGAAPEACRRVGPVESRRRIGDLIDVNPGTLRGWVEQAEVDAGVRAGGDQ
jgi:hypothetical protein